MEDFETMVPGMVDYINDITYDIKRIETSVSIPHMDGCGLMLHGKTRMVRLPWVKGLLVNFPFDKFIQEKCGGEATVCDIYGNEHNIIAEGIKYIFTKSPFNQCPRTILVGPSSIIPQPSICGITTPICLRSISYVISLI